MKIRALIADDEPLAREWVRSAVAEDPDLEVIGEAGDGFEAAEAIRRLKPDLVFLDVQMPGLDGFGVLEALSPEEIPAVVFVTAFDQYAVRAFEAQAVDYLMKPFSRERVEEAVRRVRELVKGKSLEDFRESIAKIVEKIRRDRSYPEWVLLKAEGKNVFVKVRDIDWIESSRNNVRIHVGQNLYLLHETTTAIASRLDPKRFLRIHRSAIVNIERIRELHPWFNGDYAVILRDGTQLTLSASYRDRLREFRRFGT
ncbi:MAG TPA: LytTR family DNA-binding domain-containing protein [Thermoanaerobaculia bacterium]|nr:LytTR family DNA-binding domain-containing protein [Thermoanaerobaculia bacterium]